MAEAGDHLRSFVVYLDVERGFSPHTVAAYRRDCGRFLAVAGRLRPGAGIRDALTERAVFEFLVHERQRGCEASSVRRGLSAVRTFLRFLTRERVLAANPSLLIETPKAWKYLPNVLDESEVARLLDAVVEHPSRFPLRDRAILELLYATGLRVSEILGLRTEDLRRDLQILSCLGKGSRQRIVPVSQTAIAAVDDYVSEERARLVRVRSSELLFVSRSGRRLGREVIAAMIKRYARLAGLPGTITPHTLRHSFATHLLRGGADLRVVQEILGHVKVETTEIYTHIEKSELKAEHRKYHPRG